CYRDWSSDVCSSDLDRAIRRIFTDRIAARIEVAGSRAPRRARREQMRFFGDYRGSGLPKRADIVEHPERTAMRGHHEIVVMNNHVVNRRARQMELERLPIRAIVEGNPDACFRTGVKQALALGILAHRV